MGKSIKIEGKTYPIKFGYGAFEILGEFWGTTSVQKTAKKFGEIFPGGETMDIEFKQGNALGQIALSGIVNADRDIAEEDLPDIKDVVHELLFVSPDQIQTLMTAFTESFPQQGNAQPRSKAGKKKGKK